MVILETRAFWDTPWIFSSLFWIKYVDVVILLAYKGNLLMTADHIIPWVRSFKIVCDVSRYPFPLQLTSCMIANWTGNGYLQIEVTFASCLILEDIKTDPGSCRLKTQFKYAKRMTKMLQSINVNSIFAGSECCLSYKLSGLQ